ncbi:MAG TPA: UvrD-helicase domain-containing protein [Candidatus Syntrophosphaera thermopropionivorans]|nr:UvrD-helicase domain-containing protein [Candidatus Syntrophosphaera thermopropionivorans]
MNNSTIKIIKASAGTGKTYRLAVEYVKLVLQYGTNINLDSILVLTFTRKATAEIRERIVEHLELLNSTKDKEKEAKLALIKAIFGNENKTELHDIEKKNLQEALQKIKTDHQQLQVMTIDSYINNIFRNLVNPQKNYGDFEIDDDIVEKTLPLLYQYLLSSNLELYQKVENLLKARVTSSIDRYNLFFQSLIQNRLMLHLINVSQNHFDPDSLMYLCEHNEICEEKAKESIEKAKKELINYILDIMIIAAGKNFSNIFIVDFQRLFKEVPTTFDELITKIEEMLNPTDDAIQQQIRDEQSYKLLKVCIKKLKDNKNIYNAKTLTSKSLGNKTIEWNDYLNEVTEHLSDYFLFKKFIPEQRYILSIWKEVLEEYDKLLYSNKRLTYNDVSWLTLNTLLKGDVESIDWDNSEIDNEFYFFLTHRTRYLFIDEFQDTSLLQFFILKPIMLELSSGEGSEEYGKVVVVGDEKQSIFSWRGGERDLLLNLKDILPTIDTSSGVEETLEESYRSSKAMMDFINYVFSNEALIQDLKKKNLDWEYNECKAAKPQCYPTNIELSLQRYSSTEEDFKLDKVQREFIQNFIKPAWEQNKDNKDYTMAILCRTNPQLETFQLLLEEAGIESIYQPSSLITEHNYVYPLISLLKFINYKDWLEFLTVLRSNYIMLKAEPLKKVITIISQSLKDFTEPDFSEFPVIQTLYEFHRKERDKISDICQDFLDLFLYNKKLSERDYININAFMAILQDYELNNTDKAKSISAFLDFLDDNKAQDFMKQVPLTGDIPLQLLTIHKAKGLEFDQVFVFYDLSASHNPESYNLSLYPKYKDKTFEKLSDIGITCHYDDILKYSSKKELVELDSKKEMLEEMNTLYVAFTRAKTSLSLCMAYEHKKGFDDLLNNKQESDKYLPILLTKIVRDFFTSKNIEPTGPDENIYKFPVAAETTPKPKEEKGSNKESLCSLDLTNVLPPKQAYPFKETVETSKNKYLNWKSMWLENRSNLYGNLAHYYLSFLKYNLPEEHNYALKQCILKYGTILTHSEIEEKINSLKNNLPISELFPPDYDKVFTEFTLFSEGNQYRIDRLLIDTKQKRALILDYKTGVTKEQEQLEHYKNALSNLPAIKDDNFSIDTKFISLTL